MKGRIFLIIGGIAIAGVVAYPVYKRFCRPMKEKCEEKTVVKDELSTTHNPSETAASKAHVTSAEDVYETRATVVQSVRERHSEAATVMEESLNTIFNDSDTDEIVTENTESLEETRSELDDLLK